MNFAIPNIPINLEGIFEKDATKTAKYKISAEEEAILMVWDKMVNVFEVGQNLSPTILCNEFHNTSTEEEMIALDYPEWKRDYILKNKPLYETP